MESTDMDHFNILGWVGKNKWHFTQSFNLSRTFGICNMHSILRPFLKIYVLRETCLPLRQWALGRLIPKHFKYFQFFFWGFWQFDLEDRHGLFGRKNPWNIFTKFQCAEKRGFYIFGGNSYLLNYLWLALNKQSQEMSPTWAVNSASGRKC